MTNTATLNTSREREREGEGERVEREPREEPTETGGIVTRETGVGLWKMERMKDCVSL